MGKIQQCRNGCGAYITVQEDGGKWKPFDVAVDGEVLDIHNCPKSPYNQQQQGGGGFQKATYSKKSFPSSAPPPTTATTTEAGSTLDTKRIFVLLKEQDERLDILEHKIDKILEKVEYNTQVDTDKLIGQLQTIEEVITPHLKTQIKKASDIYTGKKPDFISINHEEKADRFQNRRNTTPIVEEEKTEDENEEFEHTRKFVPENGDVDEDDKIQTED